jgi:hypothetical protein
MADILVRRLQKEESETGIGMDLLFDWWIMQMQAYPITRNSIDVLYVVVLLRGEVTSLLGLMLKRTTVWLITSEYSVRVTFIVVNESHIRSF